MLPSVLLAVLPSALLPVLPSALLPVLPSALLSVLPSVLLSVLLSALLAVLLSAPPSVPLLAQTLLLQITSRSERRATMYVSMTSSTITHPCCTLQHVFVDYFCERVSRVSM